MTVIRLPELNTVMLTGRLTRDSELRYTAKGQAVCSFDIAVNRRYKDSASNEWKDDVSYIPIVSWGPAAERCGERGKKGTPVHVVGRLKSRSWETKDGQKRSTIEVIANRVQFLSKNESTAESESSEVKNGSDGAQEAVSNEAEEVPF